jgi:hypothetical protein
MAHDAAYLAEVWQAVRRAFTEQHLTRRLKEALAFAVSVTSRSAFGTGFIWPKCAVWGWGNGASWKCWA